MRTIKTTSGHEITLDGDLLAVLEALFTEVTAKRELERSYEDLTREIEHLIAQMTPDEIRQHMEMERLYRQQVLKEQPTIQIQGVGGKKKQDVQEVTHKDVV